MDVSLLLSEPIFNLPEIQPMNFIPNDSFNYVFLK